MLSDGRSPSHATGPLPVPGRGSGQSPITRTPPAAPQTYPPPGLRHKDVAIANGLKLAPGAATFIRPAVSSAKAPRPLPRLVTVEPISAIVAVGAYSIGSIDFGVIVPRMFGVDIYSHGSGNPGATNVLRSMGRKAAAVVVVGDMAKGFGAAMLGGLVVDKTTAFACAFFAVVGHCFPVWHRFRGGKGVASAGGGVLWLEPMVGLVFAAVWVLLTLITRKASVGSLVNASLYVPALWWLGNGGWSLVWSAATIVLVVGRHHANIRRLITGAENSLAPR